MQANICASSEVDESDSVINFLQTEETNLLSKHNSTTITTTRQSFLDSQVLFKQPRTLFPLSCVSRDTQGARDFQTSNLVSSLDSTHALIKKERINAKFAAFQTCESTESLQQKCLLLSGLLKLSCARILLRVRDLHAKQKERAFEALKRRRLSTSSTVKENYSSDGTIDERYSRAEPVPLNALKLKSSIALTRQSHSPSCLEASPDLRNSNRLAVERVKPRLSEYFAH